MDIKETTKEHEEFFISEVFSRQKVKLYKIKHWLFDFGGVMIEKTFTLSNLWRILEEDLKLKLPLKKDPHFRKLRRQCSSGILSAREFLEKVIERYYTPEKGTALPPKKKNIDYYLELWFHLYSQITELYPEMQEIVERLHRAGYTVSLFSNTMDIHAKSNELKGFYKIFDHVFLSNEIGMRKPDIEKYKYVLQQLNAKPKKCIFIDDKLKNLVPARQLGIIVLQFESIEKFKQQLNEIGIGNISENLRHEFRKSYKKYKDSKKEYKLAKKSYKKAKKEFLKKKKSSLKKRQLYYSRRKDYEKKKLEYQKQKKKKKKNLISKFRILD